MPVLQVHDVAFHASHPVLADFAADLARGLTAPLGRQLAVQVGAHRRDAPLPEGSFRLGIQTEQMRDERGTPLWKAFPPRRLAEMMDRFDAVLDLSPANAPAYATLPCEALARVRFGPHVFPDVAPPHVPGGEGLLFVGAMNDRRGSVLDALPPSHAVRRVSDGTFGPALDKAIAGCAAVLNIHVQSGIYTEVPRLLKAVLNGKPLVSEPLASPMVPGVHYLTLDDWLADAATSARVCDHAARDLTAHFALRPCLLACITGQPLA